MKKTFFLLVGGFFCAAFLSGCFHGETFEEWRNQHFADDPNGFAVVEPNDTQVDPESAKFLQGISENLQNRMNFKKKVRIIASQNTTAFLNASNRWGSVDDKRKALNHFAQKLISGFGGIADFQIVNTEAEALHGLVEPVSGSQNEDIYTLAFNVTGLNAEKVWKEESYFDDQGNVRKRSKPYCQGSFAASVVLLDPHGEQKLTLDSSGEISFAMSNGENDSAAAERCCYKLIDDVSSDILRQYARKTAPPAYVRKLCGNGLFAEIPLGSRYGLEPGMAVSFFHFVKFKDIGTGKTTLTKQVLADGVVVRTQDTNSWVKINLYHYRKVHIGTLVHVK